ncbi:Clp protease [Hyphomicrobium nitrativorans NL23]|uniref:Clp protease n=1 Tax=Hyphomicrobium nitrativorans NL23 TaxID=1029756 RepID=V5SC14_9HYPH|nr:Clp protease N-terminal domain-containing protein [Hyphomicrobium nitrativorans]AHB47570.1 Clp protease [Hyphomicrobium nitrativorans NL23]
MTAMIVDELARIPMSPFLTATLTRAADYATAQAHREVTLEHLLLALAEDPEATVVLKASHIDLHRLTAEVSDHLGRFDDRIDPSSGQPIAISADLRRILEAAAAAARQGRRREINGAIVLAAIVGDGKSPAAHMLRVQGLTFEEAIRALQHVTAAPPSPAPQPLPPQRLPEPTQPAPVEYAPPHGERTGPPLEPPPNDERTSPPTQPPSPFGERTGPPTQPPAPEPARPATTEEILAAARERLEARKPQGASAPGEPEPSTPAHLPRANYPDRGSPLPPRTAPAPPPAPVPAPEPPAAPTDRAYEHDPSHTEWPPEPQQTAPSPQANDHFEVRTETHGGLPPRGSNLPASWDEGYAAAPSAPPPQRERRRAASSGPFVGSWPLIEAGQLIENIPRRMRVGIPVVAEARIARADVKALAEGLAGGGAAFRHEIVVTKAMSVRLRSPGGGFTIENRSPETQWIENVLGLGNDEYASWRWTLTPMARGRRQLQLIVSARTVGADGMTAETALPDQLVDVKVAINYSRTALKWAGWIGAAVAGGLLAKFGETGWVVLQIMFARHFGG